MKRKHRHVIAKIFLVIGVLDTFVFTLTVWAGGGAFSPALIIRPVLSVGLPTLFVLGVFDKEIQQPQEDPGDAKGL
ncbi:MAG: hypothetical protein OXK79_07305 [Chloroflexota bacterium]|nr:hypothetical protein [Chloroflexota bacterium]